MSATATLPELLSLLEAGHLVVLPNARAAAALRSAFDSEQKSRSATAWEPARALSWQQFTNGLWSDLITTGAESRLLLNRAQEHSLWRELFSTNNDPLLAADSLAELAASSWSLAAAHNVTSRLRATANSHDSRAFADTAAKFIKRCERDELLSAALLDEALRLHIEQATLTPPASLHLVGFDTYTPSQTSLVEAFRANGTQIIEYALASTQTSDTLHAVVEAPTEQDELHLAARWIRNFLEQKPDAHLAVLVPDLDNDRANIEAAFRNVLAPELQSIQADLSSTPWEFSSGEALSSLPIVAALLTLTRWVSDSLPLEDITSLLLTPYFGLLQDRELAARFDSAALRKGKTLLRPELDLPALLSLADSRRTVLPSWPRSLHREIARAGDLTKPRTFADWSEFIRNLAHAAGWPGERTLNPTEFEATRAWDAVLDLVSTLDFSGRRFAFAEFLQILRRQAQTTTFTGPATNAPVQVMSIEQAEGSVFDTVVFLRATDANWPRSPQPDPLLSWPLQRSLHLAGVEPAAATSSARDFTQALLTRTNTALFFHAAEDADGKLRPSPLLAELNLRKIASADLLPLETALAPLILESFSDSASLPPLASSAIRGGARVLQLQAACGFRAFAEFRLHAHELEDFTIGLDAPDSGQLIHHALRRFWSVVKTQAQLRSFSDADRERHLRSSIDEAVSRQLVPSSAWDEAFVALQKRRLFNLLNAWLDCELERSPFTVVEGEHVEHVDIGPLNLELRFDRIDRLDGSSETEPAFVLVDYKTGASGTPSQWEGDRPDDPQLPLYALPYAPGELKALTFAKVHAGGMKWLGYQAAPGILPQSRSNRLVNLPEFIEAWRATLTQLARDFADGHAFVAPKSYPQTCTHCAQRLLCRLDPATLRNLSEEDLAEKMEEADG